jgi:MFS family permease
MVLISLFLSPLVLVGFVYSRGFTTAFLYYMILTILAAMGSVASQALFIDFSPREHRGRISALTSLIGATQNFNFAHVRGGTIVGALGNMVGGALYNKNYSLPLLLMAALIGVTGVIGAVFVREPKEKEA